MTSRSTVKRSERQIIKCPWREGEDRGGGGGGRGGSQLEVLETIQKDGVFSTTYRCQETDTGKQYLVKRVYLQWLQDRDIEYRLKEVHIWRALRHRHILTCLTGWRSDVELWMLSKAATSTVERVVKEKALAPPQPLFENWLYQLASALQYLHEFSEKTILHRNLKPSNIMVVPHYILKLSDFGFSKELEAGQEMTESCVGTALIMSPEMVNQQPYCTKTDLWSLGVTAVYIATLQDAICAQSFDTVFTQIRQGKVLSITGQYSTDIEELVHSLLQVNPLHRPSASQFIIDLRRRCSDRCVTPPTAHSYPGRQIVPQKTPSAFSKALPARQRVGSKLADAGWTRSAAGRAPYKKIPKSGKPPLLLAREDEQPEASALSDRATSGHPSAHDASPTFVDLSQSLLHLKLGTRHSLPNMETPYPRRELRSQPPRDFIRERRQDLHTASAAVLSKESTLVKLAEAIQRYGDKMSTEKTSGKKLPKRASKVMASDFRKRHGVPNERACAEEDVSLITLSHGGKPTPSGLINTFPGAFNLDKALSASLHLSAQHHPSLAERASSKDRSSRSPDSSDCDDVSWGAANGRGTGSCGQLGSSLLQDSSFLDASVESWPDNMRQYWSLAEDLVTRLGSDTFSKALKCVTMFPEGEVQQWLEERGVDPADHCLDSLRKLAQLDACLDDDMN